MGDKISKTKIIRRAYQFMKDNEYESVGIDFDVYFLLESLGISSHDTYEEIGSKIGNDYESLLD